MKQAFLKMVLFFIICFIYTNYQMKNELYFTSESLMKVHFHLLEKIIFFCFNGKRRKSHCGLF
uniref:Uncharacterized protein n=1 Tax=Manihot esculenta TaxID=3983 RepID=A0A2C9UPY8_MANES